MKLGRIPWINCYPVYGAIDRGLVSVPAELVSGTAAELNDLLAAVQIRQIEVVADASERFDGLGRRSVQLGVGVTEPAGHRAAHLEVEPAAWIERDLRVHILDSAFEIHRIHDGSAHVDLLQAAARSP